MMVDNADRAGPVNRAIWPVPPVVTLLFIAAGIALEVLFPLNPDVFTMWRETVIVGGLIIAVALLIGGLAAREVTRAKTAIRPGYAANALVTTGVFSRTRNPIYLGFVLLVLGLGILLVSPWLVLLSPVLAIYFNFRVIRHEEAYLIQRFGEQYLSYTRRVRRWF